jgi:adenosylmethionine-8-amino-7-oxononanoate aminotransferase
VRGVEGGLIEHLSPLAELKSAVREVRVLGAIGVYELHRGLDRDAMAPVQRQLVDEGVWLRPFGKLLYTMPPFNCEELNDEHVKKIGEAMFKVASKLASLFYNT